MADSEQVISKVAQTFVVSVNSAGQRLDQFVTQHLGTISRSKVQKLIEDGGVSVNDVVISAAKHSLKVDDKVDVRGVGVSVPRLDERPQLPGAQLKLDILFEDDCLVVINKPAGMAAHPGDGAVQSGTLVDALLQHAPRWSRMQAAPGDKFRPGIVHRLDRDTSGVMVCCKDDFTHDHLAGQFKDKTNLREYMALLDGFMPAGHIERESYLHRDTRVRNRFASIELVEHHRREQQGDDLSGYRYAKTEFWRRATFGKRLTFVTARLHTGRTHQIRVHAADLKLPVLGDQRYHRPCELPATFANSVRAQVASLRRQMLHARILGFIHPKTGEKLAFEAPPPPDFLAILQLLSPYDDKATSSKT